MGLYRLERLDQRVRLPGMQVAAETWRRRCLTAMRGLQARLSGARRHPNSADRPGKDRAVTEAATQCSGAYCRATDCPFLYPVGTAILRDPDFSPAGAELAFHNTRKIQLLDDP